jgi:exosortase A
MSAIVGKGAINADIVKGGISCIFWTLTLQTTIKYVILTLRADNKGEGGIFSLYTLVKRTKFKWLIVLGILGFGWLLASLASVLVVKQLALIFMIPVAICAIMGFRFTWAIAFPLAYLFFAVPVGESLIPPLIDFTANFTVSALQMTGIPVYREGNFFSIPSGNWSVVEACSGLRYLIASVTLGTLYAYLTYISWVKRLIFIIFSIIVPILANGLRAYLIVMTGHLSDMKLAVGVDHLIYGWVFFGFVMLLLFH